MTLNNPFIQFGASTAEKWRHIHFLRWWSRRLNATSGYVFVDVTACRSQSLSANQISSTCHNWLVRYNYFRFWKTNVYTRINFRPYWNSTSGFDFNHLAVICILFCISTPNFVQIRASVAEIWCHINFSRCRPRPLNTTSGFVLVDVIAFRMSKSISKPNCVEIAIWICGWDITTSVFEKQTSAILEFYFRFQSRLVRHNLHVILHRTTE